MNKNTTYAWQFYIIILVIILSSFVILTPKIASRIFHYKNSQLLTDFLQKTTSSRSIDPQLFWQTREFYCPGSFVFQRSKNTFLTYSCDWLKSEDSFTTALLLPPTSLLLKNGFTTLLYTNNILITKSNKNLIITFVLPIDQMMKANGFFDYKAQDQPLIQNKYWLDQTVITL